MVRRNYTITDHFSQFQRNTQDLLMQRCSKQLCSQYTVEYHWKPHLLLCSGCLLLFIGLTNGQKPHPPVHKCMHTCMNAHIHLLMRSIIFVSLCANVGDKWQSFQLSLLVTNNGWGTSQLYTWNMQFILIEIGIRHS